MILYFYSLYSIYSCYEILAISPVLYSVSLYLVYFIHNSFGLLIPYPYLVPLCMDPWTLSFFFPLPWFHPSFNCVDHLGRYNWVPPSLARHHRTSVSACREAQSHVAEIRRQLCGIICRKWTKPGIQAGGASGSSRCSLSLLIFSGFWVSFGN